MIIITTRYRFASIDVSVLIPPDLVADCCILDVMYVIKLLSKLIVTGFPELFNSCFVSRALQQIQPG
jgi:hypothetical protein